MPPEALLKSVLIGLFFRQFMALAGLGHRQTELILQVVLPLFEDVHVSLGFRLTLY